MRERGEAAAQQPRGFGKRRAREAAAAGLEPVRRRLARLPGFGEMQRELLGLLLHDVMADRGERIGGARVQVAARVAHQACIGGVAQQRVAEAVGFGIVLVHALQDAGVHQHADLFCQFSRRHPGGRGEDVAPHRAPDHRRHLRDALCRARAVEPGNQQFIERGGDGEAEILAESVARPRGMTGIDEEASDLLDEERNAVGARCDLAGEHAIAAIEHLLQHRRDMLRRQAAELQHDRVRRIHPIGRRRVARAEDQQHALLADQRGQRLEHRERGRVEPVQILDDEAERLAARENEALFDQHRDRRLAELLGRLAAEGRIDEADAEHSGERLRGIGARAGSAGKRGLQPGEGGSVIGRVGQMRTRPEMIEHRPQRAVAIKLGGTEAEQRRVGGDAHGEEFLDQPRLADAGLAGDEHDVAVASPRARPLRAEHGELRATSAESGEPAQAHLGAIRRIGLAQHAPGTMRLGEATQRNLAQGLADEACADARMRGLADHDAVLLGETLQARRQVEHGAHRRDLRLDIRTDEIAQHDAAGGDANAHGERRAGGRFQPGDAAGDRECGPHRVLRIALPRGGIAEIDEDAVAEIAGDVTAGTRDRLVAERAIAAQQFEQILGIEAFAERRGVDDVDEHDGERPSFPLAAARPGQRRGCRRRGSAGRQGEGAAKAHALADGQPELAQLLIGELGELVARDAVLAEGREVTGKPGGLQPRFQAASASSGVLHQALPLVRQRRVRGGVQLADQIRGRGLGERRRRVADIDPERCKRMRRIVLRGGRLAQRQQRQRLREIEIAGDGGEHAGPACRR